MRAAAPCELPLARLCVSVLPPLTCFSPAQPPLPSPALPLPARRPSFRGMMRGNRKMAEIDVEASVDAIMRVLREAANRDYIGEPVSQLEVRRRL